MSMPFYVSPEQLMKDRADFARKGIARGRSVVVVQYADGVLFASENPSQALHKVSEIYDRIAFAAVGRYNEFENLRIAGVRLADMRGYAYDRRDVTGRGLANAYAQTLGTIFSSGGEKPYEVEMFVAEIGEQRRRRPDLPPHLRRPGGRRARLRRDGWRGRRGRGVLQGALRRGRLARGRPPAGGRRAGPHGEADDRVIPAERPRGRGAGPHPHPAAQVPPDPGAAPDRAARQARPVRARPRRGRGRRARRRLHRALHRRPRRPDRPGQRCDTAAGEPGRRRAHRPAERSGRAAHCAPDCAPVSPDDPTS